MWRLKEIQELGQGGVMAAEKLLGKDDLFDPEEKRKALEKLFAKCRRTLGIHLSRTLSMPKSFTSRTRPTS